MNRATVLIGIPLVWSSFALGEDVSEPAMGSLDAEVHSLVAELVDQAQRNSTQSSWFTANLADAEGRPTPLRAQALARLIQKGALGDSFRRQSTVEAWRQGPNYVRVVLQGNPALTIIVNQFEGQAPSIRHIELSSCGICSEEERFIEDLIWKVNLGANEPILVPSFDLSLTAFLSKNPDHSSHWVAMLQTRNQKGKLPHSLLRGAELLGSEESVYRVRYSDGFIDTWRVVYEDHLWAVDYDALAPDSPLRMARRDMWRWRDPAELQSWALQRWEPTWAGVNHDLGLHIGGGAIGAAIDPLDQTVLIAVSDIDRVLSGIIRVDPYSHEVLERIPISAPSTRTTLPIDRWYDRWLFEVAADRGAAVLHLPSRLWHIDLANGKQRLLESTKSISAVAIGSASEEGQRLIAAASPTHIAVYGGEALQHLQIPAPIIAMRFSHQGLIAVTSEGQSLEYALKDAIAVSAGVGCCDQSVREAAIHPSGDEVLLTCEITCDRGWERTSLEGDPPQFVAGVSSRPGGLSWSPAGDQFVTRSFTGGLILWRADENQPIAEFKPPGETVETHWTADGSALMTRNASGDVYWWALNTLRRERGL
jgi:hypothetical protein